MHDTILARFTSVGGAEVRAMKVEPDFRRPNRRGVVERWACTGCGTGKSLATRTSRSAANRHAATCRAKPRR